MKLSRYCLLTMVWGICLGTDCATKAQVPVASQPAPPPPMVIATPAPPTPSAAPVLPLPMVASTPVIVPPVPFNGPLPANVLAWDSELKSIDAHEGDGQGHLFFSFTNVSPKDVVISNVHPGCGCTTADFPTPQTFAPGAGGTIKVAINLHGKSGTLFKNLTVTTDKGIKTLNFRVNILPAPQIQLTDADRAKMLKVAQADRQAVFKPECASCHVQKGAGQYGKFLYDADCGICHEGEHRATMVPNLHALKVPTNAEFWRTWIAHGKPGSLMPAFASTDGGPLSDMQIATLAQYLAYTIPSKPAP
jgi:cytochrome c553